MHGMTAPETSISVYAVKTRIFAPVRLAPERLATIFESELDSTFSLHHDCTKRGAERP
jgi:hypothetical protein